MTTSTLERLEGEVETSLQGVQDRSSCEVSPGLEDTLDIFRHLREFTPLPLGHPTNANLQGKTKEPP